MGILGGGKGGRRAHSDSNGSVHLATFGKMNNKRPSVMTGNVVEE